MYYVNFAEIELLGTEPKFRRREKKFAHAFIHARGLLRFARVSLVRTEKKQRLLVV